jgi:exopolysaccharide production protein ExoZ
MEFVAVQYLRALAALAVVLFHIENQISRMGYEGAPPRWLESGVDIFFVISGFIMWVTTYGKPITPFEFYRRRVIRIVPLYWALTAFMALVQLLSPALLQSSRFDVYHAISSFLFIPSLHPVLGTMEPVLIPGWTLNYEMFFYLLFGATLLLPERDRMGTLVWTLVALTLIGFVLHEQHTTAAFYTSGIVLEFGFGMLIAHLFLKGPRIPSAAAWAMLAGGFIAIVLIDSDSAPRPLVWGVPAALIVFATLIIESNDGVRRWALPHFLGDASYSIYLSHGIVLSAFGQVWRKLGFADLPGGLLLFVILAMAVACIGGSVLYVLLEKPLLGLLKKKKQVPPVGTPAPAV